MAATCATSTSPFAAAPLMDTPSRSPPSPEPHRTATTKRRFDKRAQFDLYSTSASSQEGYAPQKTLLKARLQRASSISNMVIMREGVPARLPTAEELAKLRMQNALTQTSDGSALGSWSTDEDVAVLASKPIGMRAVLEAPHRNGGRKNGDKVYKPQPQHFEHARGRPPFIANPLGAPPRSNHPPASILPTSFETPSFPQRSPSSSPCESIQIKGFEIPGDSAPSLIAPQDTPSIPKPPPPTPAPFLLPSLLFVSRRSTPSPAQVHSADEGLQLSGLDTGNNSANEQQRPRQRRITTNTTIMPQKRSQEDEGVRVRPPFHQRRATTSCASPPVSPTLPDSSLSLSFVRKPGMTRQGSMGESFGKLYEGDKIAKQESIRRNMARLHRIDKTGKGRTAAGRYASSMGASRSPRRGGEPQLIPEYNDDGSESEGTADSDMEVVYDRFEPSVFASASSNSGTSLSSASSMQIAASAFSIYSKDRSPLHSSPRSLGSPLIWDSSPLERSPSITALQRPTFSGSQDSSTPSPTVSRCPSSIHHRSTSSSDSPNSPRRGSNESGRSFGDQEERGDRLRRKRAVGEDSKEEVERKRVEALKVVGRDPQGRKEGVFLTMRKWFGLV